MECPTPARLKPDGRPGCHRAHVAAQPEETMRERRKFSRLTFETHIELIVAGKSYPSALIDISVKGALVDKPPDWPDRPRLRCDLKITLETSPVKLLMTMEVAHEKWKQLGLRCIAIDVESMTHLRRLLELNLGDPTLVERELFMLG